MSKQTSNKFSPEIQGGAMALNHAATALSVGTGKPVIPE